MGQVNCCEADRGDHDLIMNFNVILWSMKSMKTEDPVEAEIPPQLKKEV